MSLEQALRLQSLEGYLHCRACLDSAFAKRCRISGDRHVFPAIATVGQMTSIMRRHHWYFGLLSRLRLEGQHEPIEVCVQGTCLREGHHRIAAAEQLGWSHLWWTTSRERCDHQPFIPGRIQDLLDQEVPH